VTVSLGGAGSRRRTVPGDVEPDGVRFDANGLVAAVVQDAATKDVLMVAWMDAEALRRTLAEGRTWFFSRSRRCLWAKGQTSGNVQRVRAVLADCDADTLLVVVDVEGSGVSCHTGARTCFERPTPPVRSAAGGKEA
jgi:phosphoribosyl-AMP cyclohydrolase